MINHQEIRMIYLKVCFYFISPLLCFNTEKLFGVYYYYILKCITLLTVKEANSKILLQVTPLHRHHATTTTHDCKQLQYHTATQQNRAMTRTEHNTS
jgi:hypothetical protein